MDNKNLSNVRNRITIPSNGGLVTIEIGGETKYIEKGDLANEMYDQMGLGTASKENVGISGGVLVGNIQGEGVMRYNGGLGVHTIPEKGAFNKDFAGSGSSSTVARADHSHAELSTISFDNNAHIAVFQTTGVELFTINEQMLKDKMSYAPVKDISPAIGYTVYNIIDPNMVDVTTDVIETIEYQGGTGTTTAPSGHVMKRFKQLVISGLSASKNYAIKVNFTDNGGIAVIAGASS